MQNLHRISKIGCKICTESGQIGCKICTHK
nr:MAG TPA: hypothetical protein [Bacteriophage sp.]